MGWAADRWRLYGPALRELVRSVMTGARRIARGPRWRVPRPERLLFAPQDLRTSDPTVAQDLYAGVYALRGHALELRGRSPFVAARHAPDDWASAFYAFAWLRHLRAANTALARDHARALLEEAMGPRRRELNRGIARATPVVAHRLISFLCQSPLVLNGASHKFYQSFLATIGRMVAILENDVAGSRVPAQRLGAAIGLSYAALCCSGFENRLRRATRLLSAELDAQVLSDGGHVSRHPGALVELLLDLLPLRLLYASRGVQTPESLRRAIDRMMPMLRYLRHPDGELALFNGMGATTIDHVATLLSYDDMRGAPPSYAEPSGYARLAAGDTVVIADTGAIPPLGASGAAHAGCLSFELSGGGGRLIVNVGGSPVRTPEPVAFRSTAAHSTVELGGASSATILDGRQGGAAGWLRRRLGPLLVAGPRHVVVDRGPGPEGGLLLSARHDGYRQRFGLLHQRTWRLDASGSRLDGEDRLLADGKAAGQANDAVLRFHLHPSVAAHVREGGEIRLDRGALASWSFTAETGAVSVEDSIYLGGAEGWRPTSQIAVRLPAGTDQPIRWRFERVAEPLQPDPDTTS